MLRWAIELGQININTEVSILSQHMCAPPLNCLEGVYKTNHYIDKNEKVNPGQIGLDSTSQEIDERLFDGQSQAVEQWKDFYPEAIDQLPHDMPEPLGNSVQTICYVDVNHAENLNRRSHSGILFFVNNTPVLWYSKRQNMVKWSSFGSEFVALRIAVEMVEGSRYKLRMFEVPLDGASIIFCNNKSVVTNSSVPTSMLNKRHNVIFYHRVSEAQASGKVRIGWIPGDRNADLLTKMTMDGNVRHSMVKSIFQNKAVKWRDNKRKRG